MNIGNTPNINGNIPEIKNDKKTEQKTIKETKVDKEPNTISSKDDLSVSKLPSGKQKIITNIDISDNSMSKNDKADMYISKINDVLTRKNPTLELKDKEEIIGILKQSLNDKSLEKLVKRLDRDNALKPLYQDLGTLVNQGTAGGAVSGVLALFTLGASLVSEANQNRAFEMKRILQEGKIDSELINNLDK